MSPFPQSVADSSTFPAVFLSPPGIIEAAFVSWPLSAAVLRRISNGHAGSVYKVSWIRLV